MPLNGAADNKHLYEESSSEREIQHPADTFLWMSGWKKSVSEKIKNLIRKFHIPPSLQ
jgi:hypothetical protein